MWALDSGEYAVRETPTCIKLFKNFKETKTFKPPFAADALLGGALLCVQAGEVRFFFDHLLPITYHLSPIAYHLSPIANHLFPITYLFRFASSSIGLSAVWCAASTWSPKRSSGPIR